MIADWVAQEFKFVNFGDRRLNQRLETCVTLAAGMGESTPDRSKSVAALKATYRFADNPKVTMHEIFASHNEATIERCTQQECVYFIQDTTESDLTKPTRQVAGVGPLGTDKRQGFFYHPLYAITKDGLPLGVVDQIVWTRDPHSLDITKEERQANRKRACFEEKESCRWLEMMQSAEQIARQMPHVKCVMVADSEADITQLFCEANELPKNYHFIIRQCHAHCITAAFDSHAQNSLSINSLDDALSQAVCRGTRVVAIGGREESVLPDDKKRQRKQPRISRKAVLEIRAISVTIAGPRCAGGGTLPPVTINVVEARETNPPEGEVPVRWILFTSLPIETLSDLFQVLDGYCLRWGIELFFKTLKSGLKIEDMKYETLKRYLVVFAMLTVVAWRVEYLKGATRSDPESSCEKYFSRQEWTAIMAFLRRPIDPQAPPRMHEFMLAVAQLGGYIRKKSQGPPGSKTIWRGMARFETIVQAFAVFNEIRCGV